MSEHHCRHCCTHKKDRESPRRRHLSPRSYKTHRRYRSPRRRYRSPRRRYRSPRRRYYIVGDREWQLAHGVENCSICYEPGSDDDPLSARCNNELQGSKHYFHEHCLDGWVNSQPGMNRCPLCNSENCRNLPAPLPPQLLVEQQEQQENWLPPEEVWF